MISESENNNLIQFIESLELSKEITNILLDNYSFKEYKPKETIASSGEESNSFGILLSGIIRYYQIQEDTESDEVTLQIFEGPKVIAFSIESYLRGKARDIEVESLSVSKIFTWKRELDLQLNHSEEWIRIRDYMFANFIEHQKKREVSMLVDSAQTRYKNFTESHPSLINYVPLKYIASYLNMKPETLSRIRAQKL